VNGLALIPTGASSLLFAANLIARCDTPLIELRCSAANPLAPASPMPVLRLQSADSNSLALVGSRLGWIDISFLGLATAFPLSVEMWAP